MCHVHNGKVWKRGASVHLLSSNVRGTISKNRLYQLIFLAYNNGCKVNSGKYLCWPFLLTFLWLKHRTPGCFSLVFHSTPVRKSDWRTINNPTSLLKWSKINGAVWNGRSVFNKQIGHSTLGNCSGPIGGNELWAFDSIGTSVSWVTLGEMYQQLSVWSRHRMEEPV